MKRSLTVFSQVDLQTCLNRLTAREHELSERIAVLTVEAKHKSTGKDIAGAKRKILERLRCQEQLVGVNNSICIIDSHANAIEATELNQSILNTIKA